MARSKVEWVVQVSIFRPGFSPQIWSGPKDPGSQNRDLGNPLEDRKLQFIFRNFRARLSVLSFI
jgi:hypothetical protein